jgi:hypothetical protein
MQSSLLEILRSIPDHRRAEGKRFDLATVLLYAILAMVAGANSYRQMHEFIRIHRQRLNATIGLELPYSPSYTGLRLILRGVDPAAFRRHAASLPTPPAVEGLTAIAVDGKTLRGSFDAFNDRKAAHMMSALRKPRSLARERLRQRARNGSRKSVRRSARKRRRREKRKRGSGSRLRRPSTPSGCRLLPRRRSSPSTRRRAPPKPAKLLRRRKRAAAWRPIACGPRRNESGWRKSNYSKSRTASAKLCGSVPTITGMNAEFSKMDWRPAWETSQTAARGWKKSAG